MAVFLVHVYIYLFMTRSTLIHSKRWSHHIHVSVTLLAFDGCWLPYSVGAVTVATGTRVGRRLYVLKVSSSITLVRTSWDTALVMLRRRHRSEDYVLFYPFLCSCMKYFSLHTELLHVHFIRLFWLQSSVANIYYHFTLSNEPFLLQKWFHVPCICAYVTVLTTGHV